jgi:NitT/TauT family transport system substrate-binding protein
MNVMAKFSRRAVALGVLASPFVSLRGAHAQAKRKVTFTLSWVPDGSNGYVYVAKELGYWDDLGLDVTVSRGYGSVAAAQAVGTGQFQFGLAAASSAIQQAAKGLPLISLATCGYDATMCILTLASNSAIKSPKDLNGKKMAVTTTSGEYPFLPLYAEKAGFNFKSIDFQQTDAIVRNRLLVSKQVDAISCFAISVVPSLVYNNYDPRVFSFHKAGLRLYNYALITKPELLKSDPKLCADFAAGLLKAIKYSMLDPDATVKAFLKQLPEVALTKGIAEQTRLGLCMTGATIIDGPTLKSGLGYSEPADYESMTDLVMKYVASPGDKRPKTADLFSNAFVHDVTFTPDEWKKAQANANPSRKYLGY